MKKMNPFEQGLRQGQSIPQVEAPAAVHACDTQHTTCVYGIPLNVNLPKPGALCPWLNKTRKFYYARIRDGVLIQLPIKGAKRGPGDVFGPSVCDAKFGCVCPMRQVLEQLRAQRIGGKR